MKKLREGFTTGTCAAAASLASVLWQKDGACPDCVALELPGGKTVSLEILPVSRYVCGVRKDAGDDPDQTDGCVVTASVQLKEFCGEVRFFAGEGIGTVTKKGLKLEVGEPAINPIPREMIAKAIRKETDRAADVTISIPGGKNIAEKTFNPRLGIVGGLSILGTTGIVRPMSEEAVKDSLRLELSMCRAEYGASCAFVTGYAGEQYLKQHHPESKGRGIVLCSNYLGTLLDDAETLGFSFVLLVGRTGKLCKPAADIMQLHSHIAAGQREIVCTHAALAGGTSQQIAQLYACNTTVEMQSLLLAFGLDRAVWHSVAEAVRINCQRRTHGTVKVGVILLEEENRVLAKSQGTEEIERAWLQCSIS